MDGCLAWLLCLLLPVIAAADGANNEWNSTTRSLSMGNIGIASAEDATTAMFYNPASLARSKRASVELFNPQFDIGGGVLSTSPATKIGSHLSLGKVRGLLEKNTSKTSYLGFSLYPNLSAQNFNFGILARGEGGAYYSGGKTHYRSRYLVIPTLGLSMGTLGGRFRLGVAVRAIQLTEGVGSLKSTDAAGYRLNAAEGFGIGLDAGALITMPWKLLPTIGIVARNVGDTTFTASAPFSVATGEPTRHEKVKMTYDAGFALFPKTNKRSGMVIGVDYRDILNQSDTALGRRINLGLEFAFNRTFYLRTGISRGYWTAGIGLASKYGSLDMGSYAEEWDSSGFRVKEDRRFSLRYGSRF